MWKYFIIYGLIARSKDKLSSSLIIALKRIGEHPSNIELKDSIEDAAKEIVANNLLSG